MCFARICHLNFSRCSFFVLGTFRLPMRNIPSICASLKIIFLCLEQTFKYSPQVLNNHAHFTLKSISGCLMLLIFENIYKITAYMLDSLCTGSYSNIKQCRKIWNQFVHGNHANCKEFGCIGCAVISIDFYMQMLNEQEKNNI